MQSGLMQQLVGRRCSFLLANGTRLEGDLTDADGQWWRVVNEQGEVLLNPALIAAVAPDGALPAAASKRRARSAGGGSPGRPWADDELRQLADAFLDGEIDRDVAARFGRTPAIIRQMRQGFEVARGNLDAEQATEIAQTWVGRWREVLAP